MPCKVRCALEIEGKQKRAQRTVGDGQSYSNMTVSKMERGPFLMYTVHAVLLRFAVEICKKIIYVAHRLLGSAGLGIGSVMVL